MLRPEQTVGRIYLHRAPIDMRKQRSGLAALVQEVLKEDPFSSAVFLFIGKRRDRIKCLWWDRNGFVVWYKVIEGKERINCAVCLAFARLVRAISSSATSEATN